MIARVLQNALIHCARERKFLALHLPVLRFQQRMQTMIYTMQIPVKELLFRDL